MVSRFSSLHARDRLWIIGLSIGLALVCSVAGVALLAGALSPTRISWLLAIVPLALAIWYGYGFLQPNVSSDSGLVSTPDYGLLLCAGGWALTVLALLIPKSAPQNGATYANASAGDLTAGFCGVLAILCILCGGILSWRAWNEASQTQSEETQFNDLDNL